MDGNQKLLVILLAPQASGLRVRPLSEACLRCATEAPKHTEVGRFNLLWACVANPAVDIIVFRRREVSRRLG